MRWDEIPMTEKWIAAKPKSWICFYDWEADRPAYQ